MKFHPNFYYTPLLTGTKKPFLKEWPTNLIKTNSPPFNKDYAQWLKNNHKDWGVVTGQASGVLVLDIDKQHNGLETLEILEKSQNLGILKSSYSVKSPSGGYHIYYKVLPNQIIPNKVDMSATPGFDIRGDGGQVKVYEDIPDNIEELLNPVPEWLLTILNSTEKTRQNQDYEDEEGMVGVGKRNHFLTRVAGQLQRYNLLSYEMLDVTNQQKCAPPVPQSEIEAIVDSISRYQPSVNLKLVTNEEYQEPDIILRSSGAFIDRSLNYLSKKELVKGTSTGIAGVDELLGGGKRLGEITGLTAVAKAGKSALLHYMIHKWLKMGVKVAFASRETSPELEVTPNLLSLSFKENAWKVDITPERIKKYKAEIENWPIVYTNGFGYLSFEELKTWMLKLKAEGYQHFVLDHLLYSMANPEDFKEVSLFIRNLKAFVNAENIHLDLVIQPKHLNLGEKIGAHSLRGGANLSQAINTLFTLERVPGATNVSKLTLEFGRSRLCNPGSIFLEYNKETTEFTEVEEDTIDVLGDGPVYGTGE